MTETLAVSKAAVRSVFAVGDLIGDSAFFAVPPFRGVREVVAVEKDCYRVAKRRRKAARVLAKTVTPC